ncbi:Transcriptional regulator, GntR family protein [Sulfitobacter noctilucae]|uniref:GntR family transcriptional regulator n=1 Tax=Sulfitobacter noctilucae TaxID=1342302 RepID=UPI0004695002|nr:GntR family transcriptional regulator [Sulfitobacter noctilucae]KIN61791.1 Transcriptional regulator, GntR family protein [Sulfitobacter noctilucae]
MQPVEHPKSLNEVTADKIRNAIVEGELALGAKLSEQRLADLLGVSRSPVRDALAALQAEGLVVISPKRGSFVFTPDSHVVDELCEHRVILETAAVRLGITRNPSELTRQLAASCDAMQSALDAGDPHGYTRADHQFHNAIIESADNRALAKSYVLMISPLKALRTHLFTIMTENTDRSLSEHHLVLNAVRDKDPDRAISLLSAHVGHLAEAFRANLSTSQDGKISPATLEA